jgi:tRNA A37 N6-isopentenylltransferase MiaA
VKVAIIGGTSIGKTDVVNLFSAQNKQSRIINFDSMQIYDYFKIGVGRDDHKAKNSYLYGFLNPLKKLTAFEYLNKAKEIVSTFPSQNTIIFEGGSRSYLKAAIESGFFQDFKIICLYSNSKHYITERIAKRSAKMIGNGLVQEVQKALEIGYAESFVLENKVMYQPVLAFIQGEIATLEKLQSKLIENQIQMHFEQVEFFRQFREIIFLEKSEILDIAKPQSTQTSTYHLMTLFGS